MKLQETLRSVLLEVASMDDVQRAIKQKQVITVFYDGDEPGGRGIRTIEPVCLGFSKSGNRVLRAWDMEGASHTATTGEQPLPGWRLFRLDKIMTFKPTGDNFTTPRPGYNFNGDKSMTRVIINAQFNDNNE
jgi:predicted DNA-binding transcriptional regulator YafY